MPDEAVMREALEGIARVDYRRMGRLVRERGGNVSCIVSVDANGYPNDASPERLHRQTRNLMQETARVALGLVGS